MSNPTEFYAVCVVDACDVDDEEETMYELRDIAEMYIYVNRDDARQRAIDLYTDNQNSKYPEDYEVVVFGPTAPGESPIDEADVYRFYGAGELCNTATGEVY